MKVVSALTRSMFPESVRNIIDSANCATRIVLATCQGTEKAVNGIDELASVMLRQQKQRLLTELTPE
jgi:hypothetical protein